jgi:hypothetical protein
MVSTTAKCDMRAELYAARLEELGWTKYRLAQEVFAIRSARGEEVKEKSNQNSVRLALTNPEKASAQANDDIVAAMGGEVVIRWKTVKEVKL